MDQLNSPVTWVVVAMTALTVIGQVANLIATTIVKLAQMKNEQETHEVKVSAQAAKTMADSAKREAEIAFARAAAAENATKKCEEEREEARRKYDSDRAKDREMLKSAVRALAAQDAKDKKDLVTQIEEIRSRVESAPDSKVLHKGDGSVNPESASP